MWPRVSEEEATWTVSWKKPRTGRFLGPAGWLKSRCSRAAVPALGSGRASPITCAHLDQQLGNLVTKPGWGGGRVLGLSPTIWSGLSESSSLSWLCELRIKERRVC